MRTVRTAALVLLAVLVYGAATSPAAAADSSTPCDYFASPNGSGHGRMTSSPFRIRDFWSVATPGTVLCLLDGVYRGSANVITPPSGLGGTSSNPIIIRALNEGRVLIDGEFARVPLHLVRNRWMRVEGINARNGTYYVARLYDTSNVAVRRSVFWDADMARESMVVMVHSSPNTLLEDVAAFGTGSRQFESYGNDGDPTTCRRCWGRWEGFVAGGDADNVVYHLNYNKSKGVTCENCLGTWSAESMPETYTETDGNGGSGTGFMPAGAGPRHIFRIRGGPDPGAINLRMLGSLGYVKATDRWRYNGVQVGPVSLLRAPGANGFNFSDAQLRHVALVISPSNLAFNTTMGFHLGHHTERATGLVVANTTSIRGRKGDIIDGAWGGGNRSAGTSLGEVPNPWTTTGSGANLCYRWNNRVMTDEPLWPWPMNDRIKAATEMAGAYSGPCPGCVGGRARRSATDVTADVDVLLGRIPSHCQE
jgi:hypothetical protein